MIVLDGKDGAVLWNASSYRYDVSSDLTARTSSFNRDVFLFRMQGRNGDKKLNQAAIHGATGAQRVVSSDLTYILSKTLSWIPIFDSDITKIGGRFFSF